MERLTEKYTKILKLIEIIENPKYYIIARVLTRNKLIGYLASLTDDQFSTLDADIKNHIDKQTKRDILWDEYDKLSCLKKIFLHSKYVEMSDNIGRCDIKFPKLIKDRDYN